MDCDLRSGFLALLAMLSVGCGSSVVDTTTQSTSTVTTSSTSSMSGTTGSNSGTGGSGGATTTSSTGAGGAGGAGGGLPATTCAGLDYCDCSANAACTVVAEPCFCPCGVEPCEPNCECPCSGGKYLGCAPVSITNPGALEGIWLIGWSGGAHHFSWVRIEPNNKLTVNDGAELSSNIPFFSCSGAGSWLLTAKLETIGLELPAPCGFWPLTFEQWKGKPVWPKGCLQEVLFEPSAMAPQLQGCRFPLSQCNADMTQCTDALAP